MKLTDIILGLCVLLWATSCEKMEDVHWKYIQDGETIYRAKPIDIEGASGYNRVQLTWKLVSPAFVERCEVTENDVLLAEVPVEYADTVRLKCLLEDITEGTHTFSIRSYDKDGNKSVRSDVIVEVYGENYLSTLRTYTEIQSIWRRADNRNQVLVRLSERASSKIAATNLKYQNTAGEEISIQLQPNENEVELNDVSKSSYFYTQDLFLPSEGCIDMFPAPAEELENLPTAGARTFTQAYKIEENTLYGQLSPSIDGTIKTLISYNRQSVVVEAGVNEITLNNVTPGDKIQLETYLQNSTNDIEYIAPVQVLEEEGLLSLLSMKDWEVVSFSSEQTGEGEAAWAFDNDFGTFWHTEYSPELPPYPHFIIVDMKENIEVRAIGIARRNGNNNIAARFSLELSLDGNTWTTIDEFSVDNSIDGLQLIRLEQSGIGRYFRLTGISSSTSNDYMCISEINLFE